MLRQLYLKWRAIPFPWRRDILAGTDLDGNMYFERSLNGSHRPRRHVIYSRSITVSEYNDKIIPVQWQAWMRHTRSQPPTIHELLLEVQRRERLAENVRMLESKEATRQSAAIEPPSKAKTPFPANDFAPESWTPSSLPESAAHSMSDCGSSKRHEN